MRQGERLPRERHADRVAREAHVNVLVAANRFADDVDRICREEGASHAQYVALWVLCLAQHPDDGLPVGAIADGLLNRASDTTRLVARLERGGLVERIVDERDRRRVLVRATPLGRERFEAMTRRLRAYHREQWAELDEGELETLSALLVKALWGPEPPWPEPPRK